MTTRCARGSTPTKLLDSQDCSPPRPPGVRPPKASASPHTLKTCWPSVESHFGSIEDGWPVDLLRHERAQHTGDVRDAPVRRQWQAGGGVYTRCAKPVPRNAPSREKKKRGWQQVARRAVPGQRSAP